MRDLYSVLNLSRRANSWDIKAAYWALAKQFHPDVNVGDQDAERWTKEINRAYEILGNPDARAAYDLELARQRAKARRSFLSGAAAGAATLILTMGSISMAGLWKQHALQTGSAKNEMLVAKAPAQERATLRSARSEHRERGADPGQSAPHPEPSSEPPASTNPEIISAVLTDSEAPTSGTPALSSNVMEQPPEAAPSAAPSESARTDMPGGQPVLPQAPDRHPPPRTELANVASPQVEAKQPAPTATVDQKSSGEPPRRHGDRKAEAVGNIHRKPKKRLNVATVAATPRPNKPQESEREPRLVSRGATALRWPSADEPFVNLGMRKR
jgi:curved DNA-binding protein CbpA